MSTPTADELLGQLRDQWRDATTVKDRAAIEYLAAAVLVVRDTPAGLAVVEAAVEQPQLWQVAA